MAEEQAYPIAKYHFEVNWYETTIVCSEISGLTSTMEVMNYCDAKTQWVTAQPGLQKFDDIVFTKAVFASDTDFQSWHERTAQREDGYGENVVVVLMNELSEPVFIWELQGAHVFKWEQPDMNSQASEISIEKMTIVAENIFTVIKG